MHFIYDLEGMTKTFPPTPSGGETEKSRGAVNKLLEVYCDIQVRTID